MIVSCWRWPIDARSSILTPARLNPTSGGVLSFRDRTESFLEPTTRRVGEISGARQLNQRSHSDHIPLGRVVLFKCALSGRSGKYLLHAVEAMMRTVLHLDPMRRFAAAIGPIAAF
jgi:hypothetical protein